MVWPVLKVWHAILSLFARLFGGKRPSPVAPALNAATSGGHESYGGGQDSLAGGISAMLDGQYQDPGKVGRCLLWWDVAVSLALRWDVAVSLALRWDVAVSLALRWDVAVSLASSDPAWGHVHIAPS